MTTLKTLSIALPIILISSLFLFIPAISSTGYDTSGEATEHNFEQMAQDIVREITSYLKIEDQKGKYNKIDGEQRIEKIAILISPLFSQDIDLSKTRVQLDDGEKIYILSYVASEELNSKSIFEHDIWNKIDGSNFGLIAICDFDNSISNYGIMNENSDSSYLVFKVPSDMIIKKYDELIVTIIIPSGMKAKTILKAPLPIKPVVTFE